MNPRMSRFGILIGLAGIAALTLLTATLIAASKPAPSFGSDVDQYFYLAMARAPFAGPDAHHAPFSWRILPPLLAHLAPSPVAGFRILTMASLALLPAAVFWLCVCVGASQAAALAGAAITALTPVLVGQLAWDPIRPDGLGTLLVALAAAAIVRHNTFLTLVLAVALAMTKETAGIVVVFGVVWAFAVDRRSVRATFTAAIASAAVLVAVRVLIKPLETYSLISTFSTLYLPPDPVNITRRGLLATASTWNVLMPVVVWSLVREKRPGVAVALAAAVAAATAQILVAADTQRIVAAGWPFVMVAVVRELDRLRPWRRWVATGLLALLQVPWLLEYGRIVDLRLRPVEIAIALATAPVAVIACVTRRSRSVRQAVAFE